MTAPAVARYAIGGSDAGPTLDPAVDGTLVLFADVEEALHDRDRFEWLQPVIEGGDDATADRRTVALAAGILAGMRGRELVDFARTRCES